ncbi:hypothetical protein AMTR_s00203p00032500 [Amborella trichopoda]|uniref:Uncharacterized protein n=1 Tax=Amborella trichopoda TaxID=13333 RepID=W1P9R1_AMBTC|nr:hypothetical protein AMTR_s00203p00032500 [Amborella trichopoda]
MNKYPSTSEKTEENENTIDYQICKRKLDRERYNLGKHLAEHCRTEYPKIVNYCLWLLAEVAVIAADIPEVIGTAAALQILFHIPIWAGVLITGLNTFLLLGLQRYGVRKLELLLATMVFLMAASYIAELAYAKPKVSQVFTGMFIPKLSGNGATGAAIALIGALLSP